MVQGVVTRERTEKWKIASPEEYGFHRVTVPDREDCQVVVIYRLNLAAGQCYELKPGGEEMNGVCIRGTAGLELTGHQYHYGRLDSFYMAGGNSVATKAEADCVFYTGASMDEGYGTPSFRAFNLHLPSGEIHQIHGEGVGQREVFMTLNQEVQVSHLIAGLTWGGNGAWTSWPPHQHETGLEEIYCYSDMDEPHFGLHLSYIASGDVDNIVTHPVKSGSMALASRGYHPTVAPPGTWNAHFWVSVAHLHESRGHDLAVLDPSREQMN